MWKPPILEDVLQKHLRKTRINSNKKYLQEVVVLVMSFDRGCTVHTVLMVRLLLFDRGCAVHVVVTIR